MPGCNLCGSTTWTTVEQVGDTRVVRCACGLVCVTPQPDRAAIEDNYSEDYYHPWQQQEESRRRIWKRRMVHVERLRPSRGRLLDVGCGTGTFLELARERGWDVVGTEFSPFACRQAKASGFDAIEGEIWEANLPSGAFDVVTCWHVIEHVANPKRVMHEIARVLRPGGWLLLATPNLRDYLFQVAYLLTRGRRAPLYDPGERELHLFNFSEQTLRALARSAHLEVSAVGFDRGAAAVSSKRLLDEMAYAWFKLTGLHWGLALEMVARKPVARGAEAPTPSRTIAVDIREWEPGTRTGIGRLLEEFLRAAMAKRPNDRFVLLGTPSSEMRVQGNNAVLVRLPERWTAWWDQVTLSQALRREGADVLYSPYTKIPLLTSVPVVSTVHDLTFFILSEYNRNLTQRVINGLFRLFCRLALRRAAAILVDSQTTARDVQRTFGFGTHQLRLVPLATSPAYRPEADGGTDHATLSRYHLKPGYVLYVGNGSPHKNVPLLLRAHAGLPLSLRQSRPLVLAGITHLGILNGSSVQTQPLAPEHLRVLGIVPEEDLPALYRGATVFACPSTYEGFGLPVLEAMACGTPVLCSSAPALVELTGQSAQHVEQWDEQAWRSALQKLLEDSGRRARLAVQGPIRAATYSPQRMTDELLHVLDEVVEINATGERQTCHS